MNLIQFKDVYKQFNAKYLLENINLVLMKVIKLD